MRDLIFTTPNIYCPDCGKIIPTSIEELNDKEEIICPNCKAAFIPDIDVERFLKLIEEVEKN